MYTNGLNYETMLRSNNEHLRDFFIEKPKGLKNNHNGVNYFPTESVSRTVDETISNLKAEYERIVMERFGHIEACGTPISSGKYCDKCNANMINGLTEAGKRESAPVEHKKLQAHENRMRFIRSDRKI